jgi:hypothetical protein
MIEQKYRDSLEQGRKRDVSVVDEELLINKRNKKLFRAAAYGMGIGIGLFIFAPILPDIVSAGKMDALRGLFHTIGWMMILYSLGIGFGFFLLRPYIKLVLFLLNWVLVPITGIYSVIQAIKIVSG